MSLGHFVDRKGFEEYGQLLEQMIELHEKRLSLLGKDGFNEIQVEIKELQKRIDTYETEKLKLNN